MVLGKSEKEEVQSGCLRVPTADLTKKTAQSQSDQLFFKTNNNIILHMLLNL